MSKQVRSPEGFVPVDNSRPVRVLDAAASPVQAEPGEVLLLDTTASDIDVLLPDARRGGPDVIIQNTAGANNVLPTPAAGTTQAIFTSGGPVVNPATVTIGPGASGRFTPIGRNGILNWAAALDALF